MIVSNKISKNSVPSIFANYDRIIITKEAFSSNASIALTNFLVSSNSANNKILFTKKDYEFLTVNNAPLLKSLEKYNLFFKTKSNTIPLIGDNYLDFAKNLWKKYRMLFVFGNLSQAKDFVETLCKLNLKNCDSVLFTNSEFYKVENKEEEIECQINAVVLCPCDKLEIQFYRENNVVYAQGKLTKIDLNVKESNQNGKFSFRVNKHDLFSVSKMLFKLTYNGIAKYSDPLNVNYIEEVNFQIKSSLTSSKLSCINLNNNDNFDNEASYYENDQNIIKYPYYGGQKVSLPEGKLIRTEQIGEGSIVKDSKGNRIKLIKELGDGGEGIVYSTDQPNRVIKIFKSFGNNNTDVKQQRIEFMTRNQLNNPLIVWPKDSIYDLNGNFAGFSMDNAAGLSLKKFIGAVKGEKTFSILDVSKETILKMIISILNNIRFLHKRNIIIGDIKLENFVIKNNDPTKVYFVDCDSYQIDKYPATKISDGYGAPELPNNVAEYYRTFENEYYAIFALLFIILMKGVTPYQQVGTELKEFEKAKLGMFPYSLDYRETEKKGRRGYPIPNRSHLPSYIKKAFINVGLKNGENFEPKKRLSENDWLLYFNQYLKDLQTGRLSRDKDANVGIVDARDTPIDYSLVDIEMVKNITIKKRSFSLLMIIQDVIREAKRTFSSSEITSLYQNLKDSGFCKMNDITFRMIKNIGAVFIVECSYEG